MIVAGAFLLTGLLLVNISAPARAADAGAGAASFWVELIEGRMVAGKAAFEATLVTPYGELKIPARAVGLITWDHEKDIATVEGEDFLGKGKFSLKELRLETVGGAEQIPTSKIRRLQRTYPSSLGANWNDLLAGLNLKGWEGPAVPPDADGVVHMTTPVNTWGAEYEGKLPPRHELSMEVKFARGARTDIHVARGQGTAYVRVSDAAKDRAGEWVRVRFVSDGELKAYVNDEEVELRFWGEQGNPTIALSSDFAEAQIRNVAVRFIE